jgi:hypothetical protein
LLPAAISRKNPAWFENFPATDSSQLQKTLTEGEEDMRTVLAALTAVLLSSTTLFAAELVNPTGRWDGVVKDSARKELAPSHGFVADSASWKSLWQKWRPNQEVPQVNFDKEIVVVGVVSGPNRVLLRPMLSEGGDLRFLVAGTRMAGPGFGYALVKVSREGVKTVNGKPIRKLIEVRGELSTGIMAIGGETTGTILATEDGTWELDLSSSKKLGELADKLAGKTVVVRGVPERREGVEIKERRIIHVQSLETMDEGDDQKAALTGTVVVPSKSASFEGRTLEVKLWQYDPFLADVSADLLDELIVRDYSHKSGTETNTRFELGKPNAVREDRAYYLTVFVTDDGKRTHMGEKDGKRGLCKVLNRGNPASVKMIVREVGR